MIRIVNETEARSILATRARTLGNAEDVVAEIIEGDRTEGDIALLRYAREFDRLGTHPLRVTEGELAEAEASLSPDMRQAIETAIRNIREYAQAQLPREHLAEFSPGRKLGWIVRPLSAVGCYVPSGRYPLPSTLLMTAVLAQTAGVPRIVVT